MNRLENWFCASGLWRGLTERKWLPFALEGTVLGEHVLEVGAGAGAATAELARRTRNVTSLEYDHKFCVKLKAQEPAARNVFVVQGDASARPFAAQTFSGAIAVLVLHHLRSAEIQDRALREICRVLKPGGIFVALEINDGWLSRAVHIGSTFVAVRSESVAGRLAAAGFSNARITNRQGGLRLWAQRA